MSLSVSVSVSASQDTTASSLDGRAAGPDNARSVCCSRDAVDSSPRGPRGGSIWRRNRPGPTSKYTTSSHHNRRRQNSVSDNLATRIIMIRPSTNLASARIILLQRTAVASARIALALIQSSAQPPASLVVGFHTSYRRSDVPRSPFTVFVETLKKELKKSQEMQENMRQLQGEAGKIQDSETMKKMREAYERARIITSLKENPRLQKAAAQLRKSGGNVSDAVGTALKQMEDSELVRGLGAISSRMARQLADSTAPIRNTEAYRAFSETLTEAFDDGGSALRIDTSGLADAREARRIKREARLRKIGRPRPSVDPEMVEQAAQTVEASGFEDVKPVKAAATAGTQAAQQNTGQASEKGEFISRQSPSSSTSASPSLSSSSASFGQPKKPAGYAIRVRAMPENREAGQSLVLHLEPAYKQVWSKFREENPLMRKLSKWRMAYSESENPFVERLRSITETVGGWFEESEMAQVVSALRTMDPQFTLESFHRDLREYVLPELIDAYHGAARPLLRQWCSEATFNVLMATIDPYVQKGMLANGHLLDLRNVDIMQGRMLENNIPVLVVSFQTSELMWFQDAKTGKVKAGRDDQADLCRYAVVMTRLENELENEVTGGWKIVELARRGQGAFL